MVEEEDMLGGIGATARGGTVVVEKAEAAFGGNGSPLVGKV